VSKNSHMPMNTPTLLTARRDPGSIDIAYAWFMPPRRTANTDADGQRQVFTGSVDTLLHAAALRTVGVKHLNVHLQRPTITATLDVRKRFASNVGRKSP